MNHDRAVGQQRQRRRWRVRKRIQGTAVRPRLTIFRSHKHIYCQLVDDSVGKTLVSVSTREPGLRDSVAYGGNTSAAQAVGKTLAERALGAGIKFAMFDRGHYQYHGRVAALAGAAREAGLTL